MIGWMVIIAFVLLCWIVVGLATKVNELDKQSKAQDEINTAINDYFKDLNEYNRNVEGEIAALKFTMNKLEADYVALAAKSE